MYLHEEYAKRHNLEIPLMRYSESVNVFLKSPNFKWQIFTGEWQEDDRHPGTYFFRWLRPKHNSYMSHVWHERITDFEPVHWDQYENFINKWIKSLSHAKRTGFRAAREGIESTLVAWEMFLFTHDGWISNNIGDEKIYDLIYRSTDVNSAEAVKYEAYLEAMRIIENEHVVENYNCIMNHTWNYSDWLAKIINDDNTSKD